MSFLEDLFDLIKNQLFKPLFYIVNAHPFLTLCFLAVLIVWVGTVFKFKIK